MCGARAPLFHAPSLISNPLCVLPSCPARKLRAPQIAGKRAAEVREALAAGGKEAALVEPVTARDFDEALGKISRWAGR